jgi:hypothetical protein
VVVVAVLAAPVSDAAAQVPPAVEAGQLLAGRGKPGEKASAERKELMSWYADRIGKHWARYEEKIGTPLKTWASEHVPEVDGGVVFYPFGGPDLATVYRMFPKADRYVLVALQRAGRPPAIREASDRKLKEVLQLFDTGLEQFAVRGFFLTKEMNRLFDWGHTVEGMTGVIAAFAELEGFDILKIEPVRVHPETGFVEVHPGDGSHRKHWISVRFYLQQREGKRSVIVDYLRVNLYDEYLRKIVGQVKFIERMSLYPSFLKAASHLMQQDGFHDIRDALLKNSPLIVQDESGLGFPALDKAFDVKLYGKFTTANKLFRADVEWRSLRVAYAKRKVEGPVDFTIGYRKPAGSCLMVATRKPAEAATPTDAVPP